MKDIDKQLDEILELYGLKAIASIDDKGLDNAKASTKQAIKQLIQEAENRPTHIMGKPIDEVCGILAMLDMERLAEMQLTMSNLKKWQKLLAEEQKRSFEKSLNKIFGGINE